MMKIRRLIVAVGLWTVCECVKIEGRENRRLFARSDEQPSPSESVLAAAGVMRSRLGAPSPSLADTHFDEWKVRQPVETEGSSKDEECMGAFFAGQGFQKVGMGRDTYESVPAARALWDEASRVLGYDLWQLVSEGPPELLKETKFAQPAILVASLAAVEKMKATIGAEKMVNLFCVAMGFSIGEYSALVYAGSLTFLDAVRLVKIRAESMAEAASMSAQAMFSVDGPRTSEVEKVCGLVNARYSGTDTAGGFAVGIANRLGADLNVLTGSSSACAEVVEVLVQQGSTKARKLAVSGAFHSPYMRPAADALAAALKTVEISPPRLPVVFNVDGKPHADPEVIRKLMEMQVTESVRLEESLVSMLKRGVRRGVEFGPASGIGAAMKRAAKHQQLPSTEVAKVRVDTAI